MFLAEYKHSTLMTTTIPINFVSLFSRHYLFPHSQGSIPGNTNSSENKNKVRFNINILIINTDIESL